MLLAAHAVLLNVSPIHAEGTYAYAHLEEIQGEVWLKRGGGLHEFPASEKWNIGFLQTITMF